RNVGLDENAGATQLNRVVMGTPGSLFSACSEGVHELIRCGAAELVTSGADVLELLGAAGEALTEVPRGPDGPRDRLTLAARQVLDAVPVARAAGAESIAVVAGRGPDEVAQTLTELADHGLVEHLPRGWRLTDLGQQ
ncbi:MAG: DNA-protecting protein DprA, partial [Nocardioidaceae bacterium]|nr:DNA-protecting protein DprA [Nocardioidaceae bacterium]